MRKLIMKKKYGRNSTIDKIFKSMNKKTDENFKKLDK